MDLSALIWIGHASFRIVDTPGRVYIDPWKLPEDPPPADLILITHSHYDHLSAPDVEAIHQKSTIVVGPRSVAEALDLPVRTLDAGERVRVGTWNVEAVPAYNIGKRFHPRSEGWIGYIVELSDGTRIYHAGDTDNTQELRSVRADVALLPCGGTYTMAASEAVEAARSMNPRVLVPMHWGDIVGSRKDAETVKAGYPPTVILEPMRSPSNR